MQGTGEGRSPHTHYAALHRRRLCSPEALKLELQLDYFCNISLTSTETIHSVCYQSKFSSSWRCRAVWLRPHCRIIHTDRHHTHTHTHARTHARTHIHTHNSSIIKRTTTTPASEAESVGWAGWVSLSTHSTPAQREYLLQRVAAWRAWKRITCRRHIGGFPECPS